MHVDVHVRACAMKTADAWALQLDWQRLRASRHSADSKLGGCERAVLTFTSEPTLQPQVLTKIFS